MKPCLMTCGRRGLWGLVWLVTACTAPAQAATNGFAFADFLLAPLRIHLLTATNEPAIHTSLTSNDVTRILGKVNRVWAQAGITFYLESLRIEPAANTTNYPARALADERAALLALRPPLSLASNCFHVFYLKQMRPNGIYFHAQGMFVKDTASLRPVAGGLDEPLPRVTAHELGHALTLAHRQDGTNLLASGMSGAWLNETEITQARAAARKKEWIQPAALQLQRAKELVTSRQPVAAQELFRQLEFIPLSGRELEPSQRPLAAPKLPR